MCLLLVGSGIIVSSIMMLLSCSFITISRLSVRSIGLNISFVILVVILCCLLRCFDMCCLCMMCLFVRLVALYSGLSKMISCWFFIDELIVECGQ